MNACQRSFSVQHASEWGIEPVPPELRRLGLLDQAVLWGNLGVSLLVLVAGALLVPALGPWPALAATGRGGGRQRPARAGRRARGRHRRPGHGPVPGPARRPRLAAPHRLQRQSRTRAGPPSSCLRIATAATAISERVFGMAAGRCGCWLGVPATAMAVAGLLTVLRRWPSGSRSGPCFASTGYPHPVRPDPLRPRRPGRPGRAGRACSGPGSTWPSPYPSPGCRWSPTTPALAAAPPPPSGARPAATSWPRSGSSPSVSCSCLIGQGDVIAALLAVLVGLLALAVLVVDETDEVFANLARPGQLKNAASGCLAAGRGRPRRGRHPPGRPGRRPGPLRELPVPARALFVPPAWVLADWYVLLPGAATTSPLRYRHRPYGGVRWAAAVWLLGFLVYNWVNPGP